MSQSEQLFLQIVDEVGRGCGEGVHFELLTDDGRLVHEAPLTIPDEAGETYFAWLVVLPERFHARWPFTLLQVVIETSGRVLGVRVRSPRDEMNGSHLLILVGQADNEEVFERLSGQKATFTYGLREVASG